MVEPLVAVDVVSALAMLGIGASFLAIWRRSKAPLHVLFAVAFTTLAVGISTVTTSEFDLSGANLAVDVVRIVAHTAAPLMMALGYWSNRRGAEVSPLRTIATSFGLAAILGVVLYAAPPAGSISVGSTRNAFIVAHAAQFVLYLAIVVLSSRNLVRAPSLRHALVPLAFLAYSFSKYSWILIDLSGDGRLVGFIFFWRFMMLGLMLTALLAPFLRGEERAAA